MSIVSNNIKYLRRLNGLTQEQFARKIGIKRSLLGAYEEARANPNLTNLKNMAHAFGISVDNLLKNDLRKIRETPDLGLPFNPAAFAPPSPLIRERENTPSQPQPLAAVVARFQPPRPSLRLVSRPITLKPVNQQGAGYKPTPQLPSAEPLRFNNQFEDSPVAKPTFREEVSPQQTIQWVKKEHNNSYIQNYQNAAFLNQLPVFQLPNLPSGHYRAFETGDDFHFAGALLIGSFIRNWYDIRDDTAYVFLTRTWGLLARRATNQVKAKGNLLLSADNPRVAALEIPIKDVLEVWEVKAFVGTALPRQNPEHVKLLLKLEELRDELNRVDLSVHFLT